MGAHQIKTRRFWFRLLLLWSGSFPIFYGASAMLSRNTWETVEYTLFQTKVERTPELDFALKPLGVYVLMFGVLLVYAAREPEKNSVIINWAALVFLARAVQRLFFMEELERLFQVPRYLNFLHVIYLVILAAALWWFRPRTDANLVKETMS